MTALEPTPLLSESRRGELPATASYSRRRWQWEPAYPGQERDGTLIVLVTTHGRRVVRTELTYYAVQVEWEACDAEAGVWSFLLEKEREPNPDGPYRCVVGGGEDWCSCTAAYFDRVGARRVPTGCRHRGALRALVEGGE